MADAVTKRHALKRANLVALVITCLIRTGILLKLELNGWFRKFRITETKKGGLIVCRRNPLGASPTGLAAGCGS
jgi:hypothetical protein